MKEFITLFSEFKSKPYPYTLRALRGICALLVLLSYAMYKFDLKLPIDLEMDSVYYQQFLPVFRWVWVILLIVLSLLYDASDLLVTPIQRHYIDDKQIKPIAILGLVQDLISLVWTVLSGLITFAYLYLVETQRITELQYSALGTIMIWYSVLLFITGLLVNMYNRNLKVSNHIFKSRLNNKP